MPTKLLPDPSATTAAGTPSWVSGAGHVDHFFHERGLGDPVSYAKTFLRLDGMHAPIANPVPDARRCPYSLGHLYRIEGFLDRLSESESLG